MTKRTKLAATAPTIKSIEDADAVLAKIAEHKREIALIENMLNERIDAEKANAAQEAQPHKTQIEVLGQALLNFSEYYKDELYKDRKSLALTFGSIGYRASTKIKLLYKKTWEGGLEALQSEEAMDKYIRTKQEPDKEALKGLSEDRLKSFGCKLVQEDTFFFETAEQDLSQAPASAPIAPGAAA
jgi:phage host-nuclease inhibitor protein Gam